MNQLDWLRLLATFGVVLIHTSAQTWQALDVNTAAWRAANFYDGLVCCSVPVFFLISGRLFLDPGRELSVKKLYLKNALRLAVAGLCWGALYYFHGLWRLSYGGEEAVFQLRGLLSAMWHGHYHMWFLPMMIAIYLITPLLRPIAKRPKAMWTFLAVTFVVVVVPYTFWMVPKWAGYRSAISAVMRLVYLVGYAHYYMLGYALSRMKKGHGWGVLLWLTGTALTISLTAWFSMQQGSGWGGVFSYLALPVWLESVGIYIMALRYFPKRGGRRLNQLCNWCFGVYLVHPMVLETLRAFGVTGFTMGLPIVISIPVLVVIAFLLSMGVSAGLNAIPVVKKWIV